MNDGRPNFETDSCWCILVDLPMQQSFVVFTYSVEVGEHEKQTE